jgi:hypothetical protein
MSLREDIEVLRDEVNLWISECINMNPTSISFIGGKEEGYVTIKQRLDAALSKPEWIPVSEPPKEVGVKYLVFLSFFGCEVTDMVYWGDFWNFSTVDEGPSYDQPTHWMPFPKGPE